MSAVYWPVERISRNEWVSVLSSLSIWPLTSVLGARLRMYTESLEVSKNANWPDSVGGFLLMSVASTGGRSTTAMSRAMGGAAFRDGIVGMRMPGPWASGRRAAGLTGKHPVLAGLARAGWTFTSHSCSGCTSTFTTRTDPSRAKA